MLFEYHGLLQCVIVYSVLSLSHGSEGQLPGHMKPLGSHRPPLNIDTTDTAPDPILFNANYVKASKPLKFKGLLRNEEVIENWQDDEYLRKQFGNVEVTIEIGKKENRSGDGETKLLSKFLNEYNYRDIYVVSDLPQPMTNEWLIPSFLLCGGYTEHLLSINLWFSSGGTKSVLHSDTADNFHCVVSGTKTFVLIDKNYSNIIGPEHETQGYYNLDVEAVNMEQYPRLVDVPWYKVVIEPGDCLYLPYLWIHHVDSVGRNLGVNIWWVPFNFKDDSCTLTQNSLPHFKFAGVFETAPSMELKWFLSNCQQEDGTIHSHDVYSKAIKRFKTSIEVIEQMMETLLPGCDGVIRVEELDIIPVNRYAQAMEEFQAASELRAPSTPVNNEEGEQENGSRDEL